MKPLNFTCNIFRQLTNLLANNKFAVGVDVIVKEEVLN